MSYINSVFRISRISCLTRIGVTLAGLAGVALATPFSSFAQSAADYPARAVKIIVAFAPGGATDTLARLAGQSLGRRLNQSFVIENRPGGNTVIGVDAVVKSPADGYTLGVTANNVATEQVVNKDWPIRIERDMTIASVFAGAGYALTVSTATGVKSLKELVAYVKANPGKVNQGQAGSISPELAILKFRLGLPPLEDIVYKGGPLAVQAVVANDVQFYGASSMDIAQLAKAGKLRAIAYTEKERDPLIPDVPTVAESGVGLDDFDAGYWFALFGPANLPNEITTKLNVAMVAMTKEPEFLAKATAFGMRVYTLNAAESRNRIMSAVKQIEQAQAAGIKLR